MQHAAGGNVSGDQPRLLQADMCGDGNDANRGQAARKHQLPQAQSRLAGGESQLLRAIALVPASLRPSPVTLLRRQQRRQWLAAKEDYRKCTEPQSNRRRRQEDAVEQEEHACREGIDHAARACGEQGPCSRWHEYSNQCKPWRGRN